ncbi:MAG: hypothetical protein IJF23_02060 [Clostridia bacterium]|nr:hypothetical protein [Clostridia bacterium]
MVKVTIKTLFLLCVFSFIFMYISGLLNFFFNFAVFLTLAARLAACMGIAALLFFVTFFIYAKTDGYNLTVKFRFDKKEQILGTIIGTLIYAFIALILIFCPSGIQKLFESIYYISIMEAFVIEYLVGSDLRSYTWFYTAILVNTPLFIAIRLLGLFWGHSIKIQETPAYEELNEKIQAGKQEKEPVVEKKKSWKDSVKY